MLFNVVLVAAVWPGFAIVGILHHEGWGGWGVLAAMVKASQDSVSSASLPGDRHDGVLLRHSASLYVPPSSSVDAPERPLRHVGRSFLQTDPLVLSSGPVISGIWSR